MWQVILSQLFTKKTALATHDLDVELYCDHALSKPQDIERIAHFKNGNNDTKDKERLEQHKKLEVHKLDILLDQDSSQERY